MFDEELITWSVDGGGHLFHRPKHRFSVTNVGGTLRILRREKLDYRFLYYMLSYVQSTIPFDWVLKAHPSVLRRLYTHLPVPELGEQKRVASILDEAFAGIAAATTNAEKNLANARSLVDVAIEEQLSRISQGQHQKTTVAQLAEDRKNSIRTGPFGSQLLHGEFVDEGIAVLGIDNVVQNQFRWDKRRYITAEKFQELTRYRVFPGDVLISIMGTCGRCAVVPDDIPLAINSKHLCCISVDQSLCLPEFLKLYFLHHPMAKNYLEERASGAIMAGLNMGIIKDLPVLLPSVNEQAEIVMTCDKLSRGLSDLTVLYSRKRAHLAELKQAILRQAFSGELTALPGAEMQDEAA
ncbi:unnamed protein product [Acidocella sp. C78]|nr:unnamed protein product [Acidocella sp. C78]